MGSSTTHRGPGGAGDAPALLTLALFAIAIASTADAFAIFWDQMALRDFGAFYSSGRAWNDGASLYAAGRTDLPNLNPPGTVAVIFAPLARLPIVAAGVLWQLAGAMALAFAAWRTWRETQLPRAAALSALAVLLVSVPARYVWLEGQITWLLLLPATEAWIAYRRGALVRSGAWLGVIIAVKPFFALSAVALGFSAAVAAAGVSGGLTAAGILMTSLQPWREWLALGPSISVTWPSSASVWTLGTRLIGAAPLDVVPWTLLPLSVTTMAVAAIGAGLTGALRARDRDARWTAAIALALLVSPLGWIYYLPLAGGALAALWSAGHWSRWMTVGVGLCCVPMNVHFWAIARGWLSGLTIGAAYTWALVMLLIGITQVGRPRVRRG